METEEGGEEGISAAVHTQMQQKWKELSKKRCAGAGLVWWGMRVGPDGGSVLHLLGCNNSCEEK